MHPAVNKAHLNLALHQRMNSIIGRPHVSFQFLAEKAGNTGKHIDSEDTGSAGEA
jgi:hypothetical protein